MKVRPRIIAGTLALALIVTLAILWYSQPSGRTVELSTSSAGFGEAAIVLTHYWDGPFEKFYVTDLKANNRRPTEVAALLEARHFEGVAWSRDGTIAAVGTNGMLAYGYDFNNHAPISAPARATNVDAHTTAIIWATAAEQAKLLQQALDSHGGLGTAGARATKKLTRWEAARYGQ